MDKLYVKLIVLIILLAIQTVPGVNGEVHYAKLIQNPDDNHSCIILEKDTLRKFRGFETQDENELKVKVKPAVQAPADSMLDIKDNSKVIEIFAKKSSVLEAHVETLCKKTEEIKPLGLMQQQPEIVKIVDGGDQRNRIDVVFMGDGYTASEREQFFQDISRLTTEMFEGVTFKSYLPVFNIWAIYVESVESGIGYNGAKNTPFQLYRAQGQLRGIYPGNAAYARQVCAMTGASGCEYPSLIGNDDFYGGLGGEFVISTKSNRTGTMVLRHEMGHNFVNVGEEYDNGQVYRGVNSASSLATLGWRHWLSSNEEPRAERATYRILQYPWADLWTEGEQSFTFTSDGSYSRWYLSVSVSAAGEEDSLEFILDGQVLPWTSTGFDDREFYDWYGDQGFPPGQHNFSVKTKTMPTNDQIPRMICSVRLHEFGSEAEFHMDNNYVSAYPTWDTGFRITYRPTNAGCLMRNMSHAEFCPVCQEGMWYQFLQRISLIDSVQVSPIPNPDGTKTVTLSTLQLGQLRSPGTEVDGETLEVRWSRGGVEQVQFRDMFQIDAVIGQWSVQVDFVTPEVRADPQGLLQERVQFTV